MGNQAPVFNVFNRVFAIILAWSVLGIAALYARDPATTIGIVERYLEPLRSGGPTALVTAIVVSALAFLVLLVEIWPGGRRDVFEVRIEGGVVEYEARVLVSLLLQALASIDGARVKSVEVDGGGNKIDVRIRLESFPVGEPSAVAEQVTTRARDTVKQLGLELRAIRLTMAGGAETLPVAVQRQASTVA